MGGVLPGAAPELTAQLRRAVTTSAYPQANEPGERLFKIIACHEIASEVTSFHFNSDFTLQKGELKAVPGHLCDGIKMDKPFNAADWKTSAPIYYFEGERDPATPMAQALHNYRSQTDSRRTFVIVKGGGHPALLFNLSDCKIAIFNEIAQGGEHLSDTLSKCANSVEVR